MTPWATQRQDPTDQLVLGLLAPPRPTLTEGVVGRNEAALSALKALIEAGQPGQSLLLWGAPGAGKTFWLQAWASACETSGRPVQRVDLAQAGALAQRIDEPASGLVWMVDSIDEADAEAQAELFRLLVQLRERGERLLATSRVAPLQMQLREDLRTRLGQGLIFELHELSEAEQLAALRARAHALGWTISAQSPDYDRLFGYMLTRLPRNLALLTQLLDATNEHALALRRPISLPLVKRIFDHSLACA